MNTKEYILNTKNYYTTYFIDDNTRPTVFIAAGGGYEYTSVRESEPVANAINKMGYHAIIINYRETKEESYPKPGIYLSYVFNLFKNDKRINKIIGMGFSAGGHLMLEVTIHNAFYKIKRPDLLVLSYPVVTSDPKYAHMGSFKHLLLGDDYNDKMLDYLSLEKHIDKDMPDLFLWNTFTDESVNTMNSLLLAIAYKENNLNLEYHTYPLGGHGLSLANEETCADKPEKINPYVARWIDELKCFLKLKLGE